MAAETGFNWMEEKKKKKSCLSLSLSLLGLVHSFPAIAKKGRRRQMSVEKHLTFVNLQGLALDRAKVIQLDSSSSSSSSS